MNTSLSDSPVNAGFQSSLRATEGDDIKERDRKRRQKILDRAYPPDPQSYPITGFTAFNLISRGQERRTSETPLDASPGDVSTDSPYPFLGNPMDMPLWKRILHSQPFKDTIRQQITRNAFPPDKSTAPSRVHQTEDSKFDLWLLKMQKSMSNRRKRFMEVRGAFTTALNCNKVTTTGGSGGERLHLHYWRTERMKSYALSTNTVWHVNLHTSPLVLSLISKYWAGVPKTNGKMSKKTFIELNVLIESALFAVKQLSPSKPLVDLPEAEYRSMQKMMEVDWQRDNKGHKWMEEAFFNEFILNILDLWCETIDPEEYCDFLASVAVYVFDTSGTMKIVNPKTAEANLSMDAAAAAARGLAFDDPETYMTVAERRFMNDKPVVTTRHAMSVTTPPIPPTSDRPTSPHSRSASPSPSEKLGNCSNMAVPQEFLTKIVSQLENVTSTDVRAALIEAAKDNKLLTATLSPHSRVVPLASYNKHRYGKHPRLEAFTLEKVVMQRMTHKLNRGTNVPDNSALLGYLHDETIGPGHLRRMIETKPELFEGFTHALNSLQYLSSPVQAKLRPQQSSVERRMEPHPTFNPQVQQPLSDDAQGLLRDKIQTAGHSARKHVASLAGGQGDGGYIGNIGLIGDMFGTGKGNNTDLETSASSPTSRPHTAPLARANKKLAKPGFWGSEVKRMKEEGYIFGNFTGRSKLPTNFNQSPKQEEKGKAHSPNKSRPASAPAKAPDFAFLQKQQTQLGTRPKLRF